jgi:PPP family 3-phenylpropionic acid transporter
MRLRFLYFVYYTTVGGLLGFFAPYLRGLGFDGKQVSLVMLSQQCTAVPAALVWGAIGDRIGTRALRFCTIGAAAALTLLPFARTPVQAACVMALTALCSGGIVPLVDSIAVRLHGPSYSRARLWGSIGFVVSAQLLGMALAGRGELAGDIAMPLSYLGCFALVAVVAFGVKGDVAHERRPTLGESFSLLHDRKLRLLLFGCMAHWAACAPYHLMFGVLVRERGFSSSVTGAALAVGVASEVVAMVAFPWLQRRFSLRAIYASIYLVSIVRWLLVSRADSPRSLVLLQLLHASTFGLWWGCSVEAMRRIVPAQLRATGQALFSALAMGAGNIIGYALAGIGYDRFGGAATLFVCAAIAEVLPLAVSALPLSEEPASA